MLFLGFPLTLTRKLLKGGRGGGGARRDQNEGKNDNNDTSNRNFFQKTCIFVREKEEGKVGTIHNETWSYRVILNHCIHYIDMFALSRSIHT